MQTAARKGNKGMQEEDEKEDEGKKKKNKKNWSYHSSQS